MAAHGRYRAHLHRIQHRRDGTDVILTQKQPQQPGKMLRLPVGLAQNVMQLFQSGNQDFPQLIENLGAAIVSGVIHFLGHLGKTLFQINCFQELIQGTHLPLQVSGIPESPIQRFQRVNGQASGIIEQVQQLMGFFIPNAAQSIRMVFPIRGPLFPPDSPDDGIIFHQIADIRIQWRQRRAKIAQRCPLVKSPQRRFQSRQDCGNHTFLQNLFRSGAVYRNVKTVKYQIYQRLVCRHICADQRNIPISAALGHPLTYLICCIQTGLVSRFRPAGLQAILCRPKGNRTLEQSLPNHLQGRWIWLNILDLYLHTSTIGTAIQFLGGISGFFKGQQSRVNLIAVQAHRYTGADPNQMFQNLQILASKIRKTVYVKNMLFPKSSLFQLFQQPGHLVSWVPLAPAAQAVVTFHQQRQFFQLLGQASGCFFRGSAQILGSNAAALEFVHSINQPG